MSDHVYATDVNALMGFIVKKNNSPAYMLSFNIECIPLSACIGGGGGVNREIYPYIYQYVWLNDDLKVSS